MEQPGEYYDYDAAGNLTMGQSGDTFAYDAENKLVQYEGGATQIGGADYYYDGDGRRVKKARPSETTNFVYNISGQLVAEYTTSTPETNGSSYLTSDTLGSPRVITKADGNVKASHDYLPFGEELYAEVGNRTGNPGQGYDEASNPTDKTRQKFAGTERDGETGLDFMQARYYSSAHGRFTSYDPLFVNLKRMIDPQRLNLYAYSRNSPLKYTDKDGVDLLIAAKTEEEARKKYGVMQKGLTAEDRKHSQFVVGDGKNGFAKGTFAVTADKDHKSESKNFQTVQTIANAKDTAVLSVVGPKENVTLYQAVKNMDGSSSVKRINNATFSQKIDLAGLIVFPLIAKPENLDFYSTTRNTEAYVASDASDEEVSVTIHHELRHVLLGDFGRTIDMARHSQEGQPETAADKATNAAEIEARRNFRSP